MWQRSVMGAVLIALTMGGCEGPAGPDGGNGLDGKNGADGVAGLDGANGADGADGANGLDGVNGADGADGVDAVTIGTVAGTVEDAAGTALDGVAISTLPASVTTTASGGSFTLSDIPIGSYTVIATMPGYNDGMLAVVGVAAGTTTNVNLVLTMADGAPGDITGFVYQADGAPLAGAMVETSDGAVTTTSAADGSYTLAGVSGGFTYVRAVPATTDFLETETADGVFVTGGATATVDLTASGRPTDSATYVGSDACALCHLPEVTKEHSSAHYNSLALDQSNMISLEMFPAVGGTSSTGVAGLSPTDGTTMVDIYACQNTSGVYSFKFGGTANCTANDGALIEVAGTYGGAGDGGTSDVPNLGMWKQRFFAKVTDVAAADAWTYANNTKGNDLLIMPAQITQSGDAAPSWGAYHGSNWNTRGRTFSKKCSGCHNVGVTIESDTSGFVTNYDYVDLNVGCESCHGPGSDHKDADLVDKMNLIITPANLTPAAQRQACGACHAADAGTSFAPFGTYGFPYNDGNASKVGGGIFVPGVYDLKDYIKGYGVSTEDGGGIHTWPDRLHGLAHRQQEPQLNASVHANNPFKQVVCTDCHDKHTLYQGPEDFEVSDGTDVYALQNPTFDDNTLCLSCHASHGPYTGLTTESVALAFLETGGVVKKNGAVLNASSFSAEALSDARLEVMATVSQHMEAEVSMGQVAYQPLNESLPVGRCASCHMPKTPKSGGWTTGLDSQGNTAMVEGDQGSHAFDVVWPYESAVLKKATGGKDTDIMPNSCGACHPSARVSGD